MITIILIQHSSFGIYYVNIVKYKKIQIPLRWMVWNRGGRKNNKGQNIINILKCNRVSILNNLCWAKGLQQLLYCPAAGEALLLMLENSGVAEIKQKEYNIGNEISIEIIGPLFTQNWVEVERHTKDGWQMAHMD